MQMIRIMNILEVEKNVIQKKEEREEENINYIYTFIKSSFL
jgi:hypothetical protein